ncbi:MAG: Cyclic di-GMP phosphodiesterase response regulator RpfG [Syntrophaceae bacterium PtaU1.Bin231]|nr:MAG: Cyclic di-GMP phosphodiesterase response regulator RpfG [Syntrophaceae bacterium PtaU1.Bin231]
MGSEQAQLKAIKPKELRVGMYVHLPLAWYEHPFLKNHFLITSENQIRKIHECGVKEVRIDPAQSRIRAETPPEPVPQAPKPPVLRTEDLMEAICDKKLPVEKKAQAVHLHSLKMMKDLMENPTVENIQQAKDGIAKVVDLILDDNATNYHLLRITSHDFNTYIHSVNVGVLSVSLAKLLFKRSDAHDMHALGGGFFLHDLGKVRIDLKIINKPAKLSDEEMREMKRHPDYGFQLLQETNQLNNECKTIVLQHHERENGTGYPQGLKGDEIHIYGRICSVADVFEALTSVRPYKKALKPFDALRVMRDEMISHFHRDLFEQFVLLFA